MVKPVKRLRILLSAYACEPNKGSEPGVGWNWALHLSEKFDVFVITRLNNKTSIEDYIAKHTNKHLHFYFYDCAEYMLKVKHLPNGVFIYYKKWQKEILTIARKIVIEEKIDIIHHITFNEFRTPGKLYKINVPFVWGPIGGGQFYRSVFKKAYIHKRNIVKEIIRNIINYIYIYFSRDIHNAIKSAAAILIADQSTEKIMPSSRNYVRLLETAYNTERNQIKVYSQSMSDTIKLLWVGGIWPRKGLKILLDALGQSDFKDFYLEIIGDGEDRQACERLVKVYGLEDKIHFTGSLSYQDVNGHYDNADVFIFTSLRDTSGNVILEAMSHGLPVITLNHHGAGEIVTNSTGTLIEISDYGTIKKDIMKAIKIYSKDRKLVELQGISARKRIETMYSWERNMHIISQVYERVMIDLGKDAAYVDR